MVGNESDNSPSTWRQLQWLGSGVLIKFNIINKTNFPSRPKPREWHIRHAYDEAQEYMGNEGTILL